MTHTIVPAKTYLLVFAALLALTALTVAAAYVDLGGGHLHYLNAVAAISIAVAKALLVILYFMHLRYGSRLAGVFVAAGVFWLLILIVLVLSDVLTR